MVWTSLESGQHVRTCCPDFSIWTAMYLCLDRIWTKIGPNLESDKNRLDQFRQPPTLDQESCLGQQSDFWMTHRFIVLFRHSDQYNITCWSFIFWAWLGIITVCLTFNEQVTALRDFRCTQSSGFWRRSRCREVGGGRGGDFFMELRPEVLRRNIQGVIIWSITFGQDYWIQCCMNNEQTLNGYTHSHSCLLALVFNIISFHDDIKIAFHHLYNIHSLSPYLLSCLWQINTLPAVVK